MAHLVKADYEETGALETDSEGVVDYLRAVQGTRVAVLVRELLGDDREGLARSACGPPTAGWTCRASPARYGGGGHTQAAGFTTETPYPELIEGLRKLVGEQVG